MVGLCIRQFSPCLLPLNRRRVCFSAHSFVMKSGMDLGVKSWLRGGVNHYSVGLPPSNILTKAAAVSKSKASFSLLPNFLPSFRNPRWKWVILAVWVSEPRILPSYSTNQRITLEAKYLKSRRHEIYSVENRFEISKGMTTGLFIATSINSFT